ncbi:MAG TPA: hypothetical protein PK313_04255 [Myxococcota bacterium]|nr:hypothetical protein [Myxococcota bacterium]
MSECFVQGNEIEVTVDGVVVRGRISCLSWRDIAVRVLEPLQSPFAGCLHIPLLGAAPRRDSFFAVTDENGVTHPSKRGWEVAHRLLEEEYRAVRNARMDDTLLGRLHLEAREEVARAAGDDRGLSAEEARARRLQARRELRAGRLPKKEYDLQVRELRRQHDRHESLERAVADRVAARYREQKPGAGYERHVIEVWQTLRARANASPAVQSDAPGTATGALEAANEGGER